jgi:hypothetical protein
MFRRLLIGAALAAGISTAAYAQPPSPSAVARKIDRGVHHAVTGTDRAVHRATHRPRRHVRHVTHRSVRVSHRSVRALCNDGRVHTGRTRVTACFNHGGIRG